MAEKFFEEEIYPIKGQKIIKYDGVMPSQRGSFDMMDKEITSTDKRRLLDRWNGPAGIFGVPKMPCVVVIRTFLRDRPVHQPSGLPWKSVRMYLVDCDGWQRIPADEVKSASSTDSVTGAPLPVEPAVIYE